MDSDANLKKAFLISLIISLSLSALLGIIIFLVGNFGEIQVKILLTTLTFGGTSLTGLCCATLFEKRRFPTFAVISLILSVWACLFITLTIWLDESFFFEDSWKVMIISIILAFSAAHISLLLLIRSNKTLVNSLLSMTILFIGLVALELIVLTLGEFDNVDDIWWRVLGVFAILDVLGTIVTPITLKVTSN